jgi:hypothetical protein
MGCICKKPNQEVGELSTVPPVDNNPGQITTVQEGNVHSV